MRLTELDARWLMKEGRRVGVIFRTPLAERPQSGRWYQVCTFEPVPFNEQQQLVWAVADDLKTEDQQHFGAWQPARADFGWTVVGGPEAATLETLTITPSIDGSRGGLWHGFITNGEIVGGI